MSAKHFGRLIGGAAVFAAGACLLLAALGICVFVAWATGMVG